MADKATPLKPGMPAISTGNKLAAIVPQSFNEIVQIAGAVVQAGMAPKSLDTTAKVTVAIMHGLELGLTPMAALQSIAVINGTPATYGDGMLALVRASGHLEDIQETVEWDKGGPIAATCRVKRAGEQSWGTHVFTRADAEKAGLWKKAGPWTQYPQRMMQMRARAWALRDKFADSLRGLRSAEEMEDMQDVTSDGHATTAPAEPKRSDYVDVEPPPAEVPPPPAEAGQAADRTAVAGEADHPAGQPEPKVTDVVEAPPNLEFGEFKSAREFLDFSSDWMADPARTADEAKQWEETFRTKIAEYGQHKFAWIKDSITDTLAVYAQILAKEQEREPGQEG